MMDVSFPLDMMTRLVHGMRPLWVEAGNLETSLLQRQLKNIAIDKPVFITGLARAGSTLLLEFLSVQANVATHQYRDFPFIFTPYFSRRLSRLLRPQITVKKERAHSDGILVSPYSPEGMEEMIWRAFKNHDDRFANFYRDHIKKLLLAAGASRYVAKNNNLGARLPRLLELFPDARIIVPVRDPVSHIGSLMRQHQRFCELADHSRAKRHLRAQGHFEFGPLRTWQTDDGIAGWAEVWNRSYAPFLPYLKHPNFLFVPFEGMCRSPLYWLFKVGAHTMLPIDEDKQEVFGRSIQLPDYYQSAISPADAGRIRDLTQDINTNFTAVMV